MNKPKKDSLINKILLYLKDTSKDLFDLSITIVFDPKKIIGGMALYKDHTIYPNKYPIYKKIYNLKSSPYFIVKNNKFYLSSKGRTEIIKEVIKEKNKIKKWDNKWRAVIFDIPELNRQERDFLRKELKWMGFKELQHSIWTTPYNIEKELLVLLKLWQGDFKGDIKFLKIDKIINEEDFKKRFNL